MQKKGKGFLFAIFFLMTSCTKETPVETVAKQICFIFIYPYYINFLIANHREFFSFDFMLNLIVLQRDGVTP